MKMKKAKQRFQIIPAVYLVLKKNDTILLSRRFNTGYADGKYSLVAGHIDGDESLITALIREAKEEANIVIQPEDLDLVHTMHCRSEIAGTTDDERVDFYFMATIYEGDLQNMEPDKCDDLSWHPLDNLPEKMVDKVRLALGCIRESKTFTTYGW